MEIECDLASIRDEDLLRKMWQQSEDFGRKKEIRSHLYKLRESRLREFYSTGGPGGEIMSNQATDLHFGKTPLTPSHGDSLVDQSFQSLKSKEIRDSLSPTHEVKFRNSGGIGGGVLVPDTTGWDVKTSSEISPDGRAFRTETMAKTDGVEKLPGGHAEFAGRNEHKSSASHQGDDKNYVKKAAESSKTHLQEKVVIGDENSGRTEVKSSSMTSSSKVTSSSSQQVFTSEDPGFDMQPRRLTQHHDQHQNMLQEAKNSSNTVHSERQQYSRNERNERQETVRNTREESQKYVDMDKASPEYQQHVQYLMSQPGAIISNTVEYPKPGVKMITTVKKLPDGTTVKTKRYETEASAAGSDATSIAQTVKQQQQQRTTSSTSTTQKSTEKRIQDSEDVFARLARTRDSNVPSNASPRRAPESPSTDDIHTRLQQSRNVNDQKFSDSIDQRSTQILRDNNQPQHPGGRNAPMTRRPSDLVDNVEMISTTNKTVKKDLSQSVRSEKITSSDFIQNERDRYIHDQDRPSRPGPDGYPETLVPITPNRHGRPSQPGDDHPFNGYNATEVIKQSSSTKSSAKFSESRRYSTETVESYQDSLIDNQDHTTRGYPSNRRPIDEPSRRSPSGGRQDFSTHGFPSVRSDKPTQQYSSDRPRPQDDYTTERVHTDRDDSTTTTRSNYSTNETRRHVTKEDFSTHGFPSVRAGTPTRDSPRRPLGSEPSPGESPKRPSGQEPKSSARPGQRPQDDYTTSTERVHTIHTDRPRPGDDSTTTTRSNYSTNETRHHVTKEDFSTHGFPSVRAGTPTSDSPRRPLGSEPSPGESPKRPSGQEPPLHQYRNPPSDGFSTHGFPSVKTDSPTNDSPRRPSSGPEPTHQGRRPTTEDFSTHGFPSVKPGRSTPTQSSSRYETPNRVDREDTVSVTSDRSNSVIYEKKIDAAHAAFARSLRCASPVESPRRDSTSDRHTPRSSVGSIRNSYSPSKSRDGRSPSRDSVTNSESSRISSGTVTKTRPTEVRRISHPKSPIGKSSPSHVSNETIDLTLTRKITAKPSPDKASNKPTPVEEQPIVAEPILRKKIFGATQDFLASESVIEKPILKSQPYYQLGQSDATLPSSYSKYRQQRGSTPNTSRRLNTTNTEEEVNTLLDTATKHITTPSLKTTPRFAKTQDHPKTKQQPDTLSSKKPLTKPEGYITLNEANQISEKQNLTTNKHVSYPNYIPSGPKADRSPSDIRPAPQSTTPHNIAPKSTKDRVKSPSNTTSSPSPRSTSPLKVDNSTSRFTKTVNRDTNTTTKTKRHPEQEPESDREPLHEPEDLDEGYVPDRKGRRRPNSQRPTSDDEGFEPDSPRAGSPTSDFEYRRPEQVETFDEEDSVVKKTRRTDKKIVTNDFLETERNVPKSTGPEEPVNGPRNTEEKPTRPDREGRKPSNLVGKPTEPQDRRQPEDQEAKRTLRRPKEEDIDHKLSPKDRKPSQLTDEPRNYEPDQGRKPYNLAGKPTEPQDHTQPEDQEPKRTLRRPKEEDIDHKLSPKDRKPSQLTDEPRNYEPDQGRKPYNLAGKPTEPQDHTQPEDQEPKRTLRRPKEEDIDHKSSPKYRKPSQLTDEPRNYEPDQGRKPYNLAGKPTEPQDHTQPEDQEPRRPLRRPKEEDTDHKSSPKDRKPSQLIDEPRNYEPDEPKETTRKPSYPKEPLGVDDKPSRPLETSRPKGAKPPLERSETFEERCRQILGMDSETVVDRTKKTQDFIETERTTVDSTRRPSDRSPSPIKKQPSDNVRIEDCDDEDDVETRRKYPSKTTTTTNDTTRGQPREKSPLKRGEDRPTDRYPDSKLPKHTAPSEFGVTVLTTTITDERSLSPGRRSPKKSQPDDVRPRDRSPSERPGKIDEATTIRKTTKIVDEIDERSNYSKPGSRPKDQSPQGNQPGEKTPTSRRTPSPQKKQPRDTVSIEDCEDEEYTNKTTDVEKTTWKQTRDKSPNDKKPRSQSPGRKLPKETTNEINEHLTTERTTKTTDDRSPSPKRKSPKQDDYYPRGRSPFEQPETDDEISTFRKTTKIVDEIDERKTHSKPGSLPKDQYPRESRPIGKSPEDDSDTKDRSPSGKRTFITTRETTFDVETSNDKSPTRPSVRGTSPSDKSPKKKSPVRGSSPTDETVTVTTTTHSVRGTSPVEKLPRDKSPSRAPVRGTSLSDKSPKKKSPVRGSSPTDETLTTTTTTHSTTTDGVVEDRYPSYTPKGSPYDHSPYDKPRPKPETTDREEVTIDISKKTKKTTTEEMHDDIFETKRPRERQPDTRDGSFFSQPRDQSPSEREPRTSRPKGDDLPREEKPTIEEIECVTTKQTSKIISDTIIGGGPRPKEQPRDRSPSKKPITEDTNQKSRPRTHPREEFPVDDLTRPSSKTTTETRRVDKTSVINDFLDTERRTHGPKRPEEDKPSQPREKSPTRKPKGPTVSDLEKSTVVKTTRNTKDSEVTNEVDELFLSSRPRDRSPTEKPIRSPRIVTTETTTEYGITSRPRSESPMEKPKKPVDSKVIDETFIRKTTSEKIKEDAIITIDLDDDTEKPSRRPRPTGNNDQPRDKLPQKPKPSDRSPSPRSRYPKGQEPLGTNGTPRSASPIQKPRFTDSTDEETNLVTTSKITNKVTKTREDVEDVDFEDSPRGKSPEKPKGSRPTGQLPREPTDSDYEETLVKRINKTIKNETAFEEKTDRSPRYYPEDKPREKSPSSKPQAQKPTEDTDDEYQKRPFGKSKPRDSPPLEGPRKPIIGEEVIIQTTSIRTNTPEDRYPKGPRGISPAEKPGPRDSPRETSPVLKSRKPGLIDDTYVEETTTESTTIKDRIQKSPRQPSPSEQPGPRDYPRGKSPNDDRWKPGYDDNVVEQITTETTIIKDHSTKSPREPSPSEKPEPRNYPRDRSPNEKPLKSRYDEIVTEKTTTESTLVKDRLTKSPRERSPSDKPGTRDSPRDKSPNEKPRKPRYDESLVEKVTTESTIVKDRLTKTPRELSPSEKPGSRNSPRDRSPEDNPRKPRYDESVVEKVTTESTIVKDRLTKAPRERSPSDKPGSRNSPRDRSPEDKPRKPRYDETVVEKISTKPTTIRDHSPNSPKSPRRSSPSEKYGPRDSPRDISPNEKPRKPRYDESEVEKLTTESTIVKDRLTKSPRGSSPTEKPRTRDHPRDRSPTDKQRKPAVGDQVRPRGASPTKKPESKRPTDEKPDETYLRETIRERKTIDEIIIDECCPEHQPREKSPLGKPKGSKPVGNTSVVKRPSKTTPVNDNSSKTPRGPSPTKSSPRERSPTQKSPLTKGSPRTTSPTEKPTKRQPIVSEYGKSVTSKFNKDIKTSEKIIVKEQPRRKSPSDKPRRNRPTSDDDTDDETTETIIAVYTIDGETVEDRPHNLSPKKSPQKPSDSTPKKPQTNGHTNHPRGISPTEKPKQRQPTDEEIEELFISSSRVTKNRETVENTTLDQPRDKSPLSGKPRGRQPTDESIDTTVIQKTRRTNRNEISLEDTEYQFPEDRPGHRSPSGGSPHRAYPREPSPTNEETILYTTEVRTKIGGSPRDQSPTEKPRERYPSGKPEPRLYPRDKSPTDKPGPRTYPRDKSPSDKPNRSRPGYLEETSNKTTNVRQIVQQTDSEKQYPKGRPVSQSPAEKPSTVRRPSKLSTTTTTTTTRNRSSIDEQRPKTQPSTREKLPTKTMPLSSPRTQPTVDRRVPAELPSPNRKPKSTFGVTTKTTTSTVTKSPVAPRPKATTESPKKPLKFPLESRPGARPTERKTAQSISPDSSPSHAGSDFENDSQKSPSPTRSVKLEDITTTVSTAKRITVASDKSDSTVRHVTTAKIQITPPTSPTKVIGTPEVKVTPSPKKPSSRVPTPKPYSKAETRTTTTRKIISKINKDGIIPTDSEDRESEVPSDIEEVDTPMQSKPSTRKLPVTERKESAPVHRVTKINKDVQMSRSTSENIIKTPITKRPSRHEPLEPQREVPNSRPTTGDRSSPKPERRPSKHLSTKTINLTTFDKIINSEDMENVVIDIQHAKSSREPSPNKIVPTPVSVDTYTGKPRYPDVVQEPEDEPKKKPVVKNIPIFEEETNDYVRCQITEVNEERLENTVRARTTKFIEKEASPQRQAPRIVTGDNVDSECLLSVHDKVSKFISTAEEVSKPKTSAPFRRDLPEQDMPEDDECLLTVDEKVSKFLKTADSVTKEVVTSKPRRVERPSIEDLDEDLKTDECVLSVSEKVNKFTTKAEKLAPSAPQRSPELVARIERQISRPSDAEPENPESEDSPASVRKFKPSSPLTERTDKKYTERQIDILSRPSVWENKTKPDVKLDDIISAKPEDEVPQKSKPLKSTDSVSKRKELFESKVSANKTTVKTKENSPEKRPTRPSNSPSDRRPSDVSDSRYPSEFTPRYVDGYPQQEPDDDVHEDVYGSSKTRRVYESSNHETTTVIRSPERSPTRKTPQPENRPSTHTTRKSPRPTEEKSPPRRYSEDHSPKYPTRDQSSTDRYTTYESSENTNRRRSSTQEYSDHKTSYNGVTRSPIRKQPSEEPEDFSTLSTRRDESTTHYTTRTVPHSPKDSPLTPTSFLDDDEEHDHSPARSTSTVSSHKHTSSTHRTTSTSKRVIEDSTTRRPRRPSGNEPATPTTPGSRTPRTRVVPETVAARRNIFEKTPGNVSPLPTGRRPSYMEPTKSSLEHRKDSLEVTKTNFSRKSSVDEEPYEPSPRASVKFGVGLKHKEEPKPKRKLSSSDIPNIEDVFELELLEEMLNVVSSYEQRRRIRAQIRVVKKLLETKTKEEVSSMTRITTIRKTSASSVRESPIPKKEAPVRPTEKYQLTDDDIDSESIVKSRHVEEREEIIRERSISPQSRTSRVVTKVTEVRKIAEPSTPTNKRTPLKKDEPKDSKPIWATKNILKKPSENEKVTRALSAKKTTSTSSSSTSRTQQQTSRQRVAIDDDCVTSSYGIGPTDEDGRPLFGIRALKKKTNTTSTNSTVQPSETTKVTGTVITEKYYSENGAEPVGERKVTVYSTNPEELVDLENQYDRRDSETVKREKLSKDGLTTVTKVQKIGKYSPGEIPSLTDDTEFTKTSSKMVRRGSVKEMSEKFIRKESSSSVTEKSSGYPKAGLILRTRRNSGATADTADQYEARAKSTEYDYDSEENVEIRTSRKHSKVVTESDDETEIRRKVNTRSFLNSAGSKVTGVDDVLERMRNADNVEVDGDTIEDREARSLLNKFLGASVLMSGMESMIPQMELRKTTTSGADNKQEVKTTRVTKTIKSGTTGGSSSSPVARETCDFEEIWDEEILKQLLEKSTSYEERRSIRARLRQLMADREASAESKASAKAKLNETKVKTSTQVAEDEESSGSEYEEIIEEYTASEDDDDQDEETSKTTSTTTVIAADKKKAIIKEEPKTKEIKKTTIIKKEEPKSSESKKTVVVETTTFVEEVVDNDDDDSASSHVEETKIKEDSKSNANNDDSDSVSDSKGQSTTTEKTETKKEDGGVVTTTTKVTTRTITGAPKPVSPFAKFQQLDKQNSLQSPKSPNTPTTPGGSSTTPIFRFTDPALNARAATFKEQLLQWCQSKTQEYENVQITNFSASWTDGLAFCALIHHFLPDAFDYSKLTPKQRRYNFELAFRVADEKAGIAPLLDVEDMVVMKRPDWKCVFTYVQSIYRRFRNCQ